MRIQKTAILIPIALEDLIIQIIETVSNAVGIINEKNTGVNST